MSRDRGARIAAVVLAVIGEVALFAAGAVSVMTQRAAGETIRWVDTILWSAAWSGFGVVGAVIVVRRPRNSVGWVMIGITTLLGLALLGPSYVEHTLQTTGELSFPATVSVPLGAMVQVLPFALVPLLLVLFPDATLPTGRMRWVVRALVVATVVDALAFAVKAGPLPEIGVDNPWGIPGSGPVLDVVTGAVGAALALLFVVTVIDLVRRFRRSTGVRRQQFRWLARAAVVGPALFVLGLLVSAGWDKEGVIDWTDVVLLSAFFLGLPAITVAIGVAVLRHRLWDIDRVVSRTLTYAVVTGLLASIYVSLVLGLQSIAGVQGSDLVVAGSTLVVAALFRPVVGRVRRLVDRRFDRARYDHDRIVAEFAGGLRDDVDLTRVERELRRTVALALAPSNTSLWVLPGGH